MSELSEEIVSDESEVDSNLEEEKHKWPKDDSCVWSKWQNDRGLPKPTQYRYCISPNCSRVERRDAPNA